QVGARTEVLPLPPDADDPHLRVGVRGTQRLAEIRDQSIVERVALVGTVQGEPRDPVDRGREDRPPGRRRGHAAPASSRAWRATSSGTSISMRSMAVERVFPCASVFSETVPPPPSELWSRKLSACRLGSS